MKVWVLTGEDHDYDTGSSAVLAVFSNKATAKQVINDLNHVKLPGTGQIGAPSEGVAKKQLNDIWPGAGDFSWLHAVIYDLHEMEVEDA